jgi:hypothetical protein
LNIFNLKLGAVLFIGLLLLVTPVRAQVVNPGGGPLVDSVCGSAVSSCLLKGSPGVFYGVYASCSAACWLMVFNSTTVPSAGATTAGKASGNMTECISILAGSAASIAYPFNPIPMSTGVMAVISSTGCATMTLSTVGFVHGTVQ